MPNSGEFSVDVLQEGGGKEFGQLSTDACQDDLHFSRQRSGVYPLDDDMECLESGMRCIMNDAAQERRFQKSTATKYGVAEQSKSGSANKDKSRLKSIILEQSWLTVYKRLFFLSLTFNLIALILAITGSFPYAKSRASLVSVGNILMAVLVRNEVCLRFLFWLAVRLLGHRWVPVKIKTTVTAILQSVGGIHSGCGLGAVMWLIYALVQSFQNFKEISRYIMSVELSIFLALLLTSLAAFPVLRHIHHNFFERMHRLAGWSSLALVWAFIVLSDLWDPTSKSFHKYDLKKLVHLQSLWLVAGTTFLVILPWLFVRRVAVDTFVPPTKLNTLLNFDGGVKAGLLARISPSPLSEWHAFGIISDGQKKHTILAGAVGDFTKSLVESPPSHIWVRSFHFAGLPYLSNLYEKVVLVATGSGIGVFLSFMMQPTRADVHVIWIAKNIEASYGNGIWKVVKETPTEKLTVIDTAVSGRPCTKELVVTTANNFGAQVVIVTSNPQGSNEIVSYCNSMCISAFGPIWDS